MIVTPDFDAFARAYQAGEAGVLRTTLVGDLLTPVAAYIKLRHGRQGAAFLLESVEGGAVRGRYSMIGLDPDLVWRCQDGVASLDRRALDHRNRFVPDERPPLESLRALIGESALPLADDLPPMAAGLFGYLGYDMVRQMERLPAPNPDALGVPDAVLVRPTVMVVFDGVRDEISLITPVRPQAGTSAKAAYETALARLENVTFALERPLPSRTAPTRRPFISSRRSPTPLRWNTRPWWRGRRITSAPATPSRWCSRSVSRRPSPCQPSRSTARSAA
jgi:anthranilate synthase component 1